MGRSLRDPRAVVNAAAVWYVEARPGKGGPCFWVRLSIANLILHLLPTGRPGQLCEASVPTSALLVSGHRTRDLLSSMHRYTQPCAHTEAPGSITLLLPLLPQFLAVPKINIQPSLSQSSISLVGWLDSSPCCPSLFPSHNNHH